MQVFLYFIVWNELQARTDGENKNDCIKLDLYYTDNFIDDYLTVDGIRLATIEDIIAMKADVIMRGGRKKDFWDLHELMDMINFVGM